MKIVPVSNPSFTPGLAGLSEVPLSASNAALLAETAAFSTGDAAWRERKEGEARDLLALGQLAPWRIRVQYLDLTDALRALVRLTVPVPLQPGADGELGIAPAALLGLTWPSDVLRARLPGYAFVQILAPNRVWHANVSWTEGSGPVSRLLCLGTRLPVGVKVVELLLMAYGALSLQSVQIDERDAAGVLHVAAARWWQRNVHRIPLSRVPFLSPDGATGTGGQP